MLDIFHGLRLVVKRRSISIDNAIFRCHWFFTSTLLVSFSVIITARQYVGQPIECHSMNKIPNSLLNSYCWVQSTFTVPQACNQHVGLDVPYPCIDNTRGREIKVYAYYQWVGMVLFVQGLLFHLPYYLWKVWENGLISAITSGLRVAVLSDQERNKKREIVVEYMYEHLGCHKKYAYKYFLCEFICLLNLVGQIWSVNRFFDGQFLSYGIEVINYSTSSIGMGTHQQASRNSPLGSQNNPSSPAQSISQHQQQSSENIPSNPANQNQHLNLNLNQNSNDNLSLPIVQSQADIRLQNLLNLHRANNRQIAPIDPMSFVFPRITKCTYYDFGSSGDVQKHDAICLLPLNIINEKIYIALWFWFFLLAILTLVVMIYRIFAIFSRAVRCRGLLSRCKLANEHYVRLIIEVCDVGDWFLFYMVAENVDPIVMREIVASLAEKLSRQRELKKDFLAGDKLLDVPEVISSDEMLENDSGLASDDREHLDSGANSRDNVDQQDFGHEPYDQEAHQHLATSNDSPNRRLGVRYNELEPRQWRSSTREPADSHSQSNLLHDNELPMSNRNDSILMEPGQCSSSTRPMSRTIAQANECLPLPRKFKKRLYSKRLWSMELGPGDFRRQLLFGERSREPAETLFQPSGSSTTLQNNTNNAEGLTPNTGSSQHQHQQQQHPHDNHARQARPPTFRLQVNAPPDSQMSGLNSAPPPSASIATLHGRRHGASPLARSQLQLSPLLSRSHSGHTTSTEAGGSSSSSSAGGVTSGRASASGSGSTSRSGCDSFVLEMQAYRRRLSPSPVSSPPNDYDNNNNNNNNNTNRHYQSITSMCDLMDLERNRRV